MEGPEGTGREEGARIQIACKLWDLATDIRVHAFEDGWWDPEQGSWDRAPSLPIVTMLGLGLQWADVFPNWTYPST